MFLIIPIYTYTSATNQKNPLEKEVITGTLKEYKRIRKTLLILQLQNAPYELKTNMHIKENIFAHNLSQNNLRKNEPIIIERTVQGLIFRISQ